VDPVMKPIFHPPPAFSLFDFHIRALRISRVGVAPRLLLVTFTALERIYDGPCRGVLSLSVSLSLVRYPIAYL